MKIFFDTNVLVSGFIGRGHVFDVVQDCIYSHEIYYTDFVLNEFKSVLKSKFSLSQSSIANNIKTIKRHLTHGISALSAETICRDKSDNQVLADAYVNKVDVILTGDKDLLILKSYKKICIIPPSQYWSFNS